MMAEFLTVLVFIFALASIITVFQSAELRRVLRSAAWLILGTAFLAGAVRQIMSLVLLPTAMARAIAEDRLPDGLSATQWLGIALSFIQVGGFILALHLLRRDLIRIGMWDKRK